MTDEALVEKMARAIRRNKFERNRRLNAYDETLPLTPEELEEARAALAVARDEIVEECAQRADDYRLIFNGNGQHAEEFAAARIAAAIRSLKGGQHDAG